MGGHSIERAASDRRIYMMTDLIGILNAGDCRTSN
jgi:hypothetical protein